MVDFINAMSNEFNLKHIFTEMIEYSFRFKYTSSEKNNLYIIYTHLLGKVPNQKHITNT